MPPKVVVLFGPTAVGKTEALLQVAEPGWEVVNADSMQVYRYMDIGTAKPGPGVRARLPHHLIDVVDPHEQFNAGMFVTRAEQAIAEILARGGVPVASGGTAFYLKSLVCGLSQVPPSDRRVREDLLAEVRSRGLGSLWAELAAGDPVYAAKIGRADTARIVRAVEVLRMTGRPLSSFQVPQSPRSDYRWLLVGLTRPRAELHERIDRRVDRMFSLGLVDEVAALVARGYGPSDPGMRAIGYRELLASLNDPEAAREPIKRHSRQYAKRQLLFFRSLPGVHWVEASDTCRLRALIEGFLRSGGAESG